MESITNAKIIWFLPKNQTLRYCKEENSLAIYDELIADLENSVFLCQWLKISGPFI